MKTTIKWMTRRYGASIAIATALAAAQTALAATDIYWQGGNGSETNPVNIYSKSSWTGSNTYSGSGISKLPCDEHNLQFGFAADAEDTTAWLKCDGTTDSTAIANLFTTHSGHFIFTSGSFRTISNFSVGRLSGDNSTVTKKDGDWTIGGDLNIGYVADSTGIVEVVGGSISVSKTQYIGYSGNGTLTINGGTVNLSSTMTMYIGKNANSVGLLEINGGTVNLDDLDVGNRGTGVLTINDGTLVVNSEKRICLGYYSGSSGTLNLNGGILKTRRIVKSSGNSALNINGGTLQANEDNTSDFIWSSVTVNVGAGGMIDNGGFDIKIPAAINGSGSLTFRGTGTTTLSGSVSYSGVTRVAPGTTLTVSKSIASAILSHGLALSGTPAIGTPYTVLSCDEDLSDLSLGNVTCPVATGCTVALGDGNTSIVVTPTGAIKAGYWTGIKDANMSDADNWSDGVPTDGADIDLSAATTVNAENRTFGAVTMGSDVVTFTGSLTATSFSDTSKVAVGANSTVTVYGNLEFSGSADEYICNTVAAGGRFAVTGDIVVKAAKGNSSYLTPSLSSCAGVIAAKGLVKEKEGGTNYGRMFKLAPDGGHVNWEIGEDGISGKDYFFVNSAAGSSAKIAATTNFTVSAAIANLKNLEFDAAGWTIALGDGSSGGIQGNGSTTVSGTGRVVANYDVDNLTSTAANKTQPFTVSGTATLALIPGARICTGVVTVNSGATLEVAESGTVSLGGDLMLADGATLGFNYTNHNEPLLDMMGKTVTFDEGETTNVVVKISAAEGVRAKGGANVLTSGGKFAGVGVSLAPDAPKWVKDVSVVDGEIVLDVRSIGTIFIIR